MRKRRVHDRERIVTTMRARGYSEKTIHDYLGEDSDWKTDTAKLDLSDQLDRANYMHILRSRISSRKRRGQPYDSIAIELERIRRIHNEAKD